MISKSFEKLLEDRIKNVFAMIDHQIIISVRDNDPLPFYDLNEMIKLEYEQCESPLRLSIKFKHEQSKYGRECDLTGNYFALIWMYKQRRHITNLAKFPKDKIGMTQLELYGLWQEDYEEVEEIEMNDIESLDAYTIKEETKEIYPLKF